MRLFSITLLAASSLLAADPVVSAFKSRYETAKLNFIQSAEAMPAEGMDYKLTPVQRSFGDWITHTAGMNYSTCAAMAGQPAPAHETAKATTKPAIERAIRESFAYCDSVVQSMTDAKALTEVTIGNRKVLPVDSMMGLLANWNAHYGNMVGYMRMKGVVPPSTARSAKK
jgi:uncharacterized damage-inducible protein DinB